jgi:hypothetical protein
MQDLRIESVDHLQRGSVNIYAANCGEDRRIIAESLYAFEKYDAVETMVAELHDRPAFCQLAAAVHGLHLAESDEIPEAEAIAILKRLNVPEQPEAIRKRAEAILQDIADGKQDDRPGQDAGAALVGVECYFWGGDYGPDRARIAVCAGCNASGSMYFWLSPHGAKNWWSHARPTYLGLPEAPA